jgi:hypothetical protein
MGVHGDLILRCLQKHGIIAPNFVVSWFFFIDNFIGLNPAPNFWKPMHESLPIYTCKDKMDKKKMFDSHMSICWSLTMDTSLPYEIRQSEYGGLGIFPKCTSFADLKPFLIGFCIELTQPCYAELSGPEIGFDSIMEIDSAFHLLYGPISLVNHECQSRFSLSTNNALMQSLTIMENSGLSIETTICGVTSNLDVSETILNLTKTRDNKKIIPGEEFLITYDQDSDIVPKIISKTESSLFICRCKVCHSVGKERGLLDKSMLTTNTASSVLRTVLIDMQDKCAVNTCTSTVVHRDPYISPRNLSCRCSNHLYVPHAKVLVLNKAAGIHPVKEALFSIRACFSSGYETLMKLLPSGSNTSTSPSATNQHDVASPENTPGHIEKIQEMIPVSGGRQDPKDEEISDHFAAGSESINDYDAIQQSVDEYTTVESSLKDIRSFFPQKRYRNPALPEIRRPIRRTKYFK